MVGEASDAKQETSHSTASVRTGSGSQAVRLVSMRAGGNHVGHFEDLELSSHGVRDLSEIKRFHMSVTDGDGGWTFSPDCELHLRAVSKVASFDAIMDHHLRFRS